MNKKNCFESSESIFHWIIFYFSFLFERHTFPDIRINGIAIYYIEKYAAYKFHLSSGG